MERDTEHVIKRIEQRFYRHPANTSGEPLYDDTLARTLLDIADENDAAMADLTDTPRASELEIVERVTCALICVYMGGILLPTPTKERS